MAGVSNIGPLVKPVLRIVAISTCVVLFVSSLYFLMEDRFRGKERNKPGGLHDQSAIGYLALGKFLSKAGYNVNYSDLAEIPPSDVKTSLIIYFLDPEESLDFLRKELTEIIKDRPPLMVLPKWKVSQDSTKNKKLVIVQRMDPKSVDAMVSKLITPAKAHVVIASPVPDSTNVVPRGIMLPQYLMLGDPDAPEVSLVRSFSADESNIPMHLMADPDVFANYGFLKKENATIALRIIDSLLDHKTKNIILSSNDEAYNTHRNIFLSILSFPANTLLVDALLIALGLIWAGRSRKPVYETLDKGTKSKKEWLIGAFGTQYAYNRLSNRQLAKKYWQVRLRQLNDYLATPKEATEKRQLSAARNFLKLKGRNKGYEEYLQELKTGSPALSRAELVQFAKEIDQLNENSKKWKPGK